MRQKRILVIVIAVAVVLLLGFLIVGHLLNADTWRGKIEASLADALGRPVQLGHLSLSLFSGNLVAESLSIADDPAFSTAPFLTAQDIKIGVAVIPLVMHHELHIGSLTIDQPKISLLRGPNGVWNYSSLGSKNKKKASQANSPMPDLTVSKFAIKGGEIDMGVVPAQAGQTRAYTGLSLEAQSFSLTSAFPFTASAKLPGNGSLDIKGDAGPLNETDASLTPVSAQISLKQADLVTAGLADPRQGISGIADLDAKVNSNGQVANATGNLHVTQLKLARNGTPSAQPADVQFTVDQELGSLSGKIDSATVKVGNATFSIGGTYQTRGNTTTAQVNVNGTNVPIDQLEAFLPSLGVQLPSGSRLHGGALTTTLNISGPVTSPEVSGPVRIVNTQLAGFDLGQRLKSIAALTGAHTGSDTTIQAASTNLRYGPQGTQLNDLAAVVASLGSASGSGTVSPTGAISFHLKVKLDSGASGGVASQAMNLLPSVFGSAVNQVTKGGIPVTIGGTTANPTFAPDFGSLAGGASPGKIIPTNPIGNALGKFLPH